MGNLLEDKFAGSVGVHFTQQVRSKGAIPDGEISQQPFSILIETKRGQDFREAQLLGHLEILRKRQGEKVLIALGNFDRDDASSEPAFAEVHRQARIHDVAFCAVSFEQFLQAIQLDYLPKNLADAIADLQEYLDEENLLPSWKYRLDVVNCKLSFDSVVAHQIYICPAAGGQYNHRRSLYLGTYRNKQVERVAQIQAVLDLESADEHTLKWNNSDLNESEIVRTARERRSTLGEDWYPARIFLLGQLYKTDFRKTTPGGMMGSKQYFEIGHLAIADAQNLAQVLSGSSWDQY
ncbi:MAG: hypothetical protein HC771_07680 [Synechococcales cyanobacterium CRU_2_2]|nr:hypothetical protein [Synechococcales cyanobacterium CRU_2_2]